MNTKRLTSRRRTRLAFAVGSMFLASLTAIAFGQTLTGTVTNATTKKPSVGDDIILLNFSTGTREVGRTQSDSTGRFTLKLDDSRKPRIFQVIHQGASYFKVVPPSSSEVRLEVYDVSKKLSDIAVTADVTRFQVKGDSLQVVRLFAVKNNSAPPRTQMSERNFEFYLPQGAQIDDCMARSPGGEPARTFLFPQKKKNLYAFMFPLRPGETQLQVLFHMPYNGAVTINPKPIYNVDHYVVMLPKRMHFTAAPEADYRAMNDPQQNDAIVQVVSHATVGQPLTFTLSGSGALADARTENGVSAHSKDARRRGSTVRDPGADAGMSSTADGRSQWYILGGLGTLVAVGTITIVRRSTNRKLSHSVGPQVQHDVAMSQTPSESVGGIRLTINDLKEQFFRLEVEHKQKRISQPEYEKAMAGLHQNLRQAIRMGNEKALT